MPTICRFFGIIVSMNWQDHNPPPLHAFYGGDEAIVDIQTLQLISGKMSPVALKLVQKWARLHRGGLLVNWERASRREKPIPLPPLG